MTTLRRTFRALRADVTLHAAFIARLEDKHKGGVIGVGPMGLA